LLGSWGCWGPSAARGSSKAGGDRTVHGKHTLPVPQREEGAAANNPSIEKPLTQAHLRLREPVADKDNISQWRALPRRGRQTGLCICDGKVSFGEMTR